MFADSMFASAAGESTWANHSRRGWSTLISFAMQAVGISCLVALPLIYNQKLPQLQSMVPVVSPRQLSSPQMQQQVVPMGNPPVVRNTLTSALIAPRRIPRIIQDPGREVLAPAIPGGGITGTCTNCGLTFDPAGVPNGIATIVNVFIPPPPVPTHKRRVSVMMEGSLIHRIDPLYPAIAKSIGIHGAVVMTAVVTKQGTVENIKVISGHPWLIRAAQDAVQQWRYRPYFLNGEAVEVDTQITVNFILSGR